MVNMNVCYKWWSVGLIKASVGAFLLFILTMFPTLFEKAQTVNPWYYLVIALIFGARPFYRFWFRQASSKAIKCLHLFLPGFL